MFSDGLNGKQRAGGKRGRGGREDREEKNQGKKGRKEETHRGGRIKGLPM